MANTYLDLTVIAQEAMGVLNKSIGLSKLVTKEKDIVPEQAAQATVKGDIVKVPKIAGFTAQDKGLDDEITLQDVTETAATINIDKHQSVGFSLAQIKSSLRGSDLSVTPLGNAIKAIGEAVDKDILALFPSFTGSAIDLSGGVTSAGLISARTALSNRGVPMSDRSLVMSNTAYGAALDVAKFVDYDKRGEGSAILTGGLRPLFGAMPYETGLMTATSGNVTGAMFHRSGIVFCPRPLASNSEYGIKSEVVTDPATGLTLRVEIGYDLRKKHEVFTVEVLYGVGILDANAGQEITFVA